MVKRKNNVVGSFVSMSHLEFKFCLKDSFSKLRDWRDMRNDVHPCHGAEMGVQYRQDEVFIRLEV